MTEEVMKTEFEHSQKKLSELFVEGWKILDELEETELPFRSAPFQEKVKGGMQSLEESTRIVNEIGIFSSNEMIDEVSTESLQYMLLPFILGKLTMKLADRERSEILNVAEIYFNDFLQRCDEYELVNIPHPDKDENLNQKPSDEFAELLHAARVRNDKISQFHRKRELEETIKIFKDSVRDGKAEEEVKREFYLNYLKKSIIDTNDELNTLKLEKQMLDMKKLKMSTLANEEDASKSHGRSTTHHHAHSHRHNLPSTSKPKPLQPFIITRNDIQKAVFGAGYPSLPVMTVDEFYQQRVNEGIFPDEQKIAEMNAAQAIAAAQNENEKEDQENAIVEEQVENDDSEYLARMRRMDEYKDVVRRGDGNRYNRS